jgi:hypothetical protein
MPARKTHASSLQSYNSPVPIVFGIALCKLLIHLYAGRNYGFFRDELYYLACSRHLDWGYVDQPPLIALVAWITRTLLGDSLLALRLIPAVAGAGEVLLAGLIARELGGKKFAQGLAALATLCATAILGVDSFISMNAFEPLFWMGCAWLVIRIVNTGDQRLWMWFGVLAGLGLENKHSMLIFGGGIFLGMLLTPERKALATPWIWIGGAIAFLIFLPNLLWNIHHHFPFLELQMNIRHSGRDVALSPLAFFGQEILTMNPLTFPIWLGGLWFLFSKAGKLYRALGWAWIFAAAVIVILSPRVYYLYPAFPLLFAGGAVLFEAQRTWKRFILPVLMIVSGAIFAPFALPILPVETYIRYAKALHFDQPRIENHKLGPLPQLFADQFGWDEMTAAVAGVYHTVPADLRSKTAIFAQNYGEAGAIDQFGPKYGLPAAISGHQNYFLWGPRDYTGESVIVMHGDQQDLESKFAEVHKISTFDNYYNMPFERFDIFYCRGLKHPLNELWPGVKRWE